MQPGDLIIFALPLLLLLWVFSRSRKQQRETATIQSAIEPGRRVMMTSGLYGDIVSVGEAGQDENTLVVELAPGVRTTWARQAVARVLPEEGPGPQRPTETEA